MGARYATAGCDFLGDVLTEAELLTGDFAIVLTPEKA
jgi:hypothetical protein